MNLNREQFLRAVERGQDLLAELKKDYPELQLKPVFSRFGPGSGQCELTTDLMEITKSFPGMLMESRETHRLQQLPGEIKNARKDKDKSSAARLGRELRALQEILLEPELKLYCGDVLIEYRPGILKYESLRRLQQDARLPAELNEVGSIRVVSGPLAKLSVGGVS